ncbi:MAG: helix-turn-helix transcriptional regulator [Bacteroidales bacterium]
MKDRIIEFLKRENKSSAQFAEEIGVQPSGISHILSGRNNPSLDFIVKMLKRYSYLSTDWLLFGNGEMYRESRSGELFSFETDQVNQKVPEQNGPIPDPGIITEIPIESTGKTVKEVISQHSGSQVTGIIVLLEDSTFKYYKQGNI